MTPQPTPLARVLPCVATAAARLRRCADLLRSAAWQPEGSAITIGLETPGTAVGSLLLEIVTHHGCLSLAANPEAWPALAGAASLADGRRRSAVAALLLAPHLGGMAASVSEVRLSVTKPGQTTDCSGVVLLLGASRLDLLALDDRLLRRVESFVGALPPVLPLRAGGLRLAGRVVLPCRRLNARRLETLRQGDVLLLPVGARLHEGLPARLCWGGRLSRTFGAEVLLRDLTMTLTTQPAFQPEPPIQEMAATVPLAQLELPIGLELAGPLLRLSEITALDIGSVVQLDIPLDLARWRITVAGQPFGRGELVAVGERLGVRLLQIDGLSPEPGLAQAGALASGPDESAAS